VTSALGPEPAADAPDVPRGIARSTDITMLCVTRGRGFARDVSARVLMFDSGHVVGSGPPEKGFAGPEHARTHEGIPERGPPATGREGGARATCVRRSSEVTVSPAMTSEDDGVSHR
jgi:ABC-type methionine transport system ATPase subunit